MNKLHIIIAALVLIAILIMVLTAAKLTPKYTQAQVGSKMKTFYGILCFLSFFYSIGIVGSFQLDKIGFKQCIITLTISLLSTYLFRFLAGKKPASAATVDRHGKNIHDNYTSKIVSCQGGGENG